MESNTFVHLHLHTHYSLLDGATEIRALLAKVKQLGMPAVAITDHGNLFGAVEFYSAAIAQGIKPIIGLESYLAPYQRDNKVAKCVGGDTSYHQLLLAYNLQGYRNLLKLASIGYLEGFYYKPRIDKQVLADFSDGLICTSTCLGAELPQILLNRDQKLAEEVAKEYLEIFGPDRFFIEVQDHGIPEQKQINPALFDMAKRLGVGAIATNDVHYLEHSDVEAHDILCCISTSSLLSDENRFKFPTDQFYLKSPEEMASLFPDHPEVMTNTLKIADMCNVELDFSKRYAPVYHPPEKKSDSDYLKELVYQGAEGKYGSLGAELRERIDYELQVISSKGFSSYFLICWDLMNFARSEGIPCGARGSGCSSVVGYCLDISKPDPLRYGLFFERFMDPDRDEMPDIDIDICQEGRQKVIDYVRQKYGHVAQIITFGTLKARAAVKDVARVMGIDFESANKITSLIPATLNMTIDKALELEPELRRMCEKDPTVAKVIDISRRIEGLARHAGVHAAGVVIADQPLETFLPLYKPPGNGKSEQQIVTQYDGPTVEKVGLLKMDFLGLRTLTTLERSRQLVKKYRDVRVDLDALDLSDQRVYALFASGDTKGIFQFESDGMRDVLRRMKPNRIEDLIAANALYRPGPMVNIDAYVARKHGEAWSTPHPLMSEALEETYGIMVYQEQVSRVVHRLGGIDLKQAFRLAKAISKKKTEMIEAMRKPFVQGCQQHRLNRHIAEQVFEEILRFGGYAFNKSHSTGYALVAYQTAYMKTYYPLEFMAALLTFEMNDTNKVVEYLETCRNMGISVRPPDINSSQHDFTPVYPAVSRAVATSAGEGGKPGASTNGNTPSNGKGCGVGTLSGPDAGSGGYLRFGMGAVKGVGERAVHAILEARESGGPFENIYDFCERVDLSVVNRGALEALIKCGAFDSSGAMRKALMLVLDRAIDSGQRHQRDRLDGQLSLLDAASPSGETVEVSYPTIPSSEQWSEAELLAHEKEALGFYITNHPLSQHQDLIRRYATADTALLKELPADTEIILGGMLTKLRTVVTRSGKNVGSKMGVLTLEDTQSSVEGILFPRDLDRYRPLLKLDTVIFVHGAVDKRREEPVIRVSKIVPLEEVPQELTSQVVINVSSRKHAPSVMASLKDVLGKHAGEKPVIFRIALSEGELVVSIRCGPGFGVLPSDALRDEVETLLGEDALECMGPARLN